MIQATVNLVISIALGIKMGLIGVFIGTLVSTMLPLIIKPIIIYKHVFEVSPKKYLMDALKQVFVLVISIVSSVLFLKLFSFDNIVLKLGIRLLVSIVFSSVLMFVFYYRSEVFKLTVARAKYMFNKRFKKVK